MASQISIQLLLSGLKKERKFYFRLVNSTKYERAIDENIK